MPHLPRMSFLLGVVALLAAMAAPVAQAQQDYDTCGGGGRPQKLPAGTGKDLRVAGNCTVPKSNTPYKYGNINILAGGTLDFAEDGKIELWTKGIIIENGGVMTAGSPTTPVVGPLTIYLYGEDQGTNPGGQGTLCVATHCGIPDNVWNSNGETKVPVNAKAPDYFYQYGPLTYDGAGETVGYFGYKSIGVSYGGTLELFGKKGSTFTDLPASNSGKSWARLNGTVTGGSIIVLDRAVDWAPGDRIVVATTDYLPSHSEERGIATISADGTRITLDQPLQYRHQGIKYDIPNDAVSRLKLNMTDAETRAAVGLLTRSIRIVSGGNSIGQQLASDSFFGGHTVARAGFKKFQVQGVEFHLLGQGGRIGHYPVHFHMARTVPEGTFVKDTSVNESMTRWYVVHSTHGVLFARNVGWKSIGHGFYIEEGTETDNKFQSNLGMYARPAIQNAVVNPRNVPGILAAPWDPTMPENVPFYSDVDHPSVFWIMNGWNDFEYNMAAGAGACGTCFWLVPGAASGHSRHMTFTGYASMQQTKDNNALLKAGTTPLRKFVGNFCTSAMNSFNTVGNTTACYGINDNNDPKVAGVVNPLTPPWCDQTNPQTGSPPVPTAKACNNPVNAWADEYYPKVDKGGGRFATICASDSTDCSTTPRCGSSNLNACMATVIDRYTSSFHWAETNFGAVWLRPQWYLFTNSVLTDVQNAGITFVTGGGYTKSDAIQGHWALARKSVFVGRTQPVPPVGQPAYALETGPFNPRGISASGTVCSGNHCLSANDGVSFPLSNFGMNQRLFSIYDGPAYQESNAYLDVQTTDIACQRQTVGDGFTCPSTTLSGRVLGMPFNQARNQCYLPNAAIAWKQPNGFYYPPAFHSENLYFQSVDIRHYVIEPLFQEGTYLTDLGKVQGAYCNFSNTMFNNFTDIDRQTELSDDDGSLTGYQKTVSVNLDPFFNAPVEAIECASDSTAKTSPYDYVTTVMYPACAVDNSCGRPSPQPPIWDKTCSNQQCFGVPMYRQMLVKNDTATSTGPIRLAGQDTYQRSTLTVNNGAYYIDTTVSEANQRLKYSMINVFEASKTYYLFSLFAKNTTTQTYQFYVGSPFDPNTDVWATRANIAGDPIKFTAPDAVAWPAGWTRTYSNGILTISMPMNFPDFQTKYLASFQENCQPSSFCTWMPNTRLPAGGTCGCNPNSPFAALCADASASGKNVCEWSQKDVDCPSGGCYGIGFKTGTTFTYDQGAALRPAQSCLKAGDPKWDVKFVPAVPGMAQSCTDAPLLPTQFCN